MNYKIQQALLNIYNLQKKRKKINKQKNSRNFEINGLIVKNNFEIRTFDCHNYDFPHNFYILSYNYDLLVCHNS